MSSTDLARQVDSLLEKLRKQWSPGAGTLELPDCGWCGEDRVLCALVGSFMVWEAPMAKAAGAIEALTRELIDANELRVSLPDELATIIGRNYPRGLERVTRLRAALNDIYRREHTVKLSHLTEKTKREARTYLESLSETPHFVASRTFLVALEGHAVPVDERLLSRLLEVDAVGDDTATPESTSGALEKAIRAGNAAEAHALLLAWVDDGGSAATKVRPGHRKTKARPVASAAKRTPPPRTTARRRKGK